MSWILALHAPLDTCLATRAVAAPTPADAVHAAPWPAASAPRGARCVVRNTHGTVVAIYRPQPYGWTLVYADAPYRRLRRAAAPPYHAQGGPEHAPA